MLTKEIKQLLDQFKNNSYIVAKVGPGERVDQFLYKYYKNKSIIYLKLFSYLNGIIYPMNELQPGDLVKIYDLDIFVQIAKQQDIDITTIVYK